MLQQTDTRFPVYLPPDEWDTKSFHHWMQRFASCCLNSVVRYAFCTRGTTDKTLLELDRKIRSFPVSLRPPESVMGTAGTSAESSQMAVWNEKEANLLYRRHFGKPFVQLDGVHVAVSSTEQVMASPFAPSFLATIGVRRASCAGCAACTRSILR
ncbi:hypothetical protein K525DRAFT_274687 [Schizophyllum commune Loenen D]|nr:hypothetical protein K525DRAFT_274687 [Schizophyllum commune Loenen D]